MVKFSQKVKYNKKLIKVTSKSGMAKLKKTHRSTSLVFHADLPASNLRAACTGYFPIQNPKLID